jgi:hypothetical protein
MGAASLLLVLGVLFVLWVIAVGLVTGGFHGKRHVPRHRLHWRN